MYLDAFGHLSDSWNATFTRLRQQTGWYLCTQPVGAVFLSRVRLSGSVYVYVAICHLS